MTTQKERDELFAMRQKASAAKGYHLIACQEARCGAEEFLAIIFQGPRGGYRAAAYISRESARELCDDLMELLAEHGGSHETR